MSENGKTRNGKTRNRRPVEITNSFDEDGVLLASFEEAHRGDHLVEADHAVGTPGGGSSVGGLAGTNIGDADPDNANLDDAQASGIFDQLDRTSWPFSDREGHVNRSGEDPDLD
jgi:hypothetical protein